jgi:hypothetical protein
MVRKTWDIVQNGEAAVATNAMCDALIAELEAVQDKTGA